MAKFAGYLHDRRWLQPVEELYGWLWRAEPYLRNTGYPIATVGILYSQQNARFYPASERGREEEDYSKGLYQALIEARIPTDTVHEDLLDESALERFRVLVLPNAACLSDRQCERIRRFVAGGGSLVATFESTLYDEWGKRRERFGLGDLFGVRPSGPTQGPMRNSYLRLDKRTPHAVLEGFEQADRMINGVWRVPVAAEAEFPDRPLLFVAPYPDLPMEEVYPRDLDRNVPELYLRETGGSRIVYFPFDIDGTFWEILDADHGRLLANAVRWAARGYIPLTVEGPGVIDTALWRQEHSLAAHLVNLTNPMMMKGPIRDIYPAGPQKVRLRLPGGASPKRVRLLAAGSEPPFDVRGGWLSLTVPSVAIHEIVAVDLA
jgi:hypothetical protein